MSWFRAWLCIGCFILPALGMAESFEVRCFTSMENSGAPINLKFSTMFVPSDKYRIGYVVYEKSKEPIPLYFSGESERVFEEGRPFEVTTKWREILKGEQGGEYTVISQGAIIYEFSYRSKSGKIFNFNYNSKATHTSQGGCNWGGV
ncbi:hypothetical protein [Pseudomonas sp. SCB32]|uniref:hypothetical protein n=1 Tax=Pseudomonas sp. SCB32 TaxID=2653853 RepID=UPI0012641707|nr:hypothetical protein [Pseudomonas sp. SCB32]